MVNTSNTRPGPEMTISQMRMELINEARDILRGNRELNSQQMKDLYLKLEHHDQFAYAAEVLLVKMQMDEDNGQHLILSDYQKLALYIYKDHSLPSSFKLKEALKQLHNHDNIASTCDPETLGLMGAIYKRKWQYDHQFKNLVLSRYYYNKGFLQWQECLNQGTSSTKTNDDGYTAINCAYTNELMAVDKLEEHAAITGLAESVDPRLLEAESIRKFILEQFIKDVAAETPELKKDKSPNWVLAIVAEAYFGLRKYDRALIFIKRYITVSTNEPWQITTFGKQLFSMAYLQGYEKRYTESHPASGTGAESVLYQMVKEVDAEKIDNCLAALSPGKGAITAEIKKSGKLGIALSGGGFRAALFHIGVLAALAEKDELRNLEMISCVSGGSIIGAYYYIELKKLMEAKEDKDIHREDYIKLVQGVEKGFLEGVQQNLRVRIFSNLLSTLKMLFNKHYSRSHRLGELYEMHLYKKIWGKDGEIYMNDLFIRPAGVDEVFDIDHDNWKRRNKVPRLVLNATSVNTGHNWQFTASWMGEPPGNIQADIDVKPRLRRMYYAEAPKPFNKFRLGYAVAASSCVPVMFHPMPLYGLYPDIDLQLIDGGLHDNQGIAALIEQECNNMIISDASNQMPSTTGATGNEAALFYRADNILQERLRELQFMDLKERNYTAQINQLITVHLKNDLPNNPVSWKDCIDPPRKIVYAEHNPGVNDLCKYGILRSVQVQLSEIRTDLDSFNDTEAYALMYSGYLQTHYDWDKKNNLPAEKKEESLWQFSKLHDYLTKPAKAATIKDNLTIANRLFFKVVHASKPVKFLCIGLLVIAGIFLTWLILTHLSYTLLSITVKSIAWILLIFLIGLLCKTLSLGLNIRSEIRKRVIFVALALFGFIVSNCYLAIFNRIYNKTGEIKEE